MTMHPELRRCAAVKCSTQIKPHLLMCSHHWAMLPAGIQTAVYYQLRVWRSGGSQRGYMLAVCRAKLFIVEAEALPYAASLRDTIATLESPQPEASHD